MIVAMADLYVSLGDSMSIDDYAGGAGRGAESLFHRNRDVDFPDWVGRDLAAAGFAALPLAFDGATARDVLQDQLPQVTAPPSLVTITVGGNDLLTCYGDDIAAAAAVERVRAIGEGILARLRRLGGDGCRIVVSTVYDPSDGTGRVPGSSLPPWPQGPRWVQSLNTAWTDLARRHGGVLADVHAAFLGHGVTAGDPTQPDPRPAGRDLWYCGMVEPNAWGAHEIRRTWWQAVNPDA
jgi:lysophospholipase L1-like esterase